ncbi:filamin A-interacting protein 1-like [Scleropages formosus]|uniref:Filamin A interacting protein 1 like n=1 Tax=Scleropages formosus TaxID=113540 RepID=A0A8C9RL55_SCLFO|nr:filamin A-interacting protein 1-like [Scleropages formosus]
MAAKLNSEGSHNRQLRQKLAALSRHVDEMEDMTRTLRKKKEELLDLRDKEVRGERGSTILLPEVDDLQKKEVVIEEKDEELSKIENQCQDLKKRLDIESINGQSTREEINKLNSKIMDFDKLEDAFSKSKQECCSLKSSLEKERSLSRLLSNELDSLKGRIRELEDVEGKLEKTELLLKEDLTKLKALTVMLVEDRKTMTDKIKQMEDKLQNRSGKIQAEQDRTTLITEKLTEESKKALKYKTELEEKIESAAKEKEDLTVKLKAAEERNNELESKISVINKRLQSLEAMEKEFLRDKEENIKASSNNFSPEDNKVKELTEEVERLKQKIKDMKTVEDDLLKTENELESLEKRYSNEQERAKILLEELEKSRKELSKYQLAEKEELSQEHILYKYLKEEEAKSSYLTREVEVLKEKLHQLAGTEDSFCRMKKDYSVLLKKLTQQEVKNKEIAKEMENLTWELERYRRFSKSLQPGLNGKCFSDLQISSKEVQTGLRDNELPDYRTLHQLEKEVLNGKIHKNCDSDDDLTDDELHLRKASASVKNANNLNNSRRSRMLFPKTKESHKQTSSGNVVSQPNGDTVQQGDVVLTHTPWQPLHIKVTPDHVQNTAMLEITSPTTENSHCYTSTAVIPTSGGPPKQRITIIQNASISPCKGRSNSSSDGFCIPDRPMSPLSMTTFSRAITPDSSESLTPERALSPIQIVSVTTSTPERPQPTEFVEVLGSHAVFRVTPERHTSWQLQRSNSSGSSVITTEDNKIHIHLGSPYIQAINTTSSPMSPCFPTEQILRPSGNSSKGSSKITSSITIAPTTSQNSRSPQIRVSNLYD